MVVVGSVCVLGGEILSGQQVDAQHRNGTLRHLSQIILESESRAAGELVEEFQRAEPGN